MKKRKPTRNTALKNTKTTIQYQHGHVGAGGHHRTEATTRRETVTKRMT